MSENNQPKRYLITAALPYANGSLHIGHLAGAYLPADVYVKYLKMIGKDVAFICGSDENGAAITIQSKKENINPQEIVDKYHKIIKESFEGINIDFDIYHRTSSELHHKTAQDFFTEMHKNNVFEEKETEQYYDEEFNQFLADRYIKGECPKCGNENAYGDQCEKCGSTLSPTELKNPTSTLSGKKPTKKKTKHWYLPLNKDEKWLKEFINEGTLNGKFHHNPKTWKKNVLGQCNSWLNDGLQPRAITRDLNWGVKVPLKDAEGKVLYVWLDAPIGYISATKQWAKDNNKNWEDYWKNDDCHLLHFIGKDNIVFHTVIFPSILNSVEGYNLPINVPANEFMNLEGDKLSTSRGWNIKIDDYLKEFPTKVDELRYVLCANMPETKDSEFTWNDFKTRINSELVATYGNFINRVLVLIHKYYEGKIPDFDETLTINCGVEQNTESKYEQEIEDLVNRTFNYFKLIEQFKFREALAKLIDIASFGNSILQFNEPWKKIKTDEANVKTVMNIAIRIVTVLAHISEPFLPNSSNKLKEILNQKNIKISSLTNKTEFENDIDKIVMSQNYINESSILFEKIEDKIIEEKKLKLQELKQQILINKNANSKVATNITFDEFKKLNLKIGSIVDVEKVEKSNSLFKLIVDLGNEKRTIVSGVSKSFAATELLNQQVVVLTNLEKKKIMGIESEGMILFSENDKKSILLSPQKKVANGSSVK